MGILGKIKWQLMSDKQKLVDLRRRGLKIGEGCEVLNGWNFGSEPYLVSIGNNVRIAAGVNITTHDGGVWVLRHKYPELRDVDKFGRVKIGDNSHIGMGATIMPGVTIGSDCIIGAGAIVTHDVPDATIAVGVPARVISTVEEYRAKHLRELVNTKHMDWEEKRLFVEHVFQVEER